VQSKEVSYNVHRMLPLI